MPLDFVTVGIIEMFLALVLGLLLIFAGWQNRSINALQWWGAAYLVYGGSIVMFFGGAGAGIAWLVSGGWMTHVAASALMWSSARKFDGRPVRVGWVCAGPTLILLGNIASGLSPSSNWNFSLGASLVAGFLLATAFETWRGREEQLLSRWPVIVLLAVSALVVLLRIPLIVAAPIEFMELTPRGGWLTVNILVSALCAVSIAFLVIAMAKERLELHQAKVARIDPLTGLSNRRGFMELARRRMQRERHDGTPVAALMFDLDRFKRVNDRFGHALGDWVLCLFAAAMHEGLRPTDVVGRIGGEEFAALLSVAKPEEAVAAAERVRAAFAAATRNVDGRAVGATVSVGVAIADPGGEEIKHLLGRADDALYRAKACGRDRVEVAVKDRPRLAA